MSGLPNQHAASPDLSLMLSQMGSLPTLPQVALRIVELNSREDVSFDELIEVIASDPATALRMIQHANSVQFGLQVPVTTLQRATWTLGVHQTRVMALSFALVADLPKSGVTAFPYEAFWRRSLTTAVAATSIVQFSLRKATDEAFLSGLLAHVGQLVLGHCVPEVYAGVLERSGANWPTIELEREVLGFDHGQLAAALCTRWKLPEVFPHVLLEMHRPQRVGNPAGGQPEFLIRVERAALLATRALYDADAGLALCKLRLALKRWFGLCPEVADDLLVRIECEIAAAAELLDLTLPRGESHAQLLERARRQIATFSLQVEPQLDG